MSAPAQINLNTPLQQLQRLSQEGNLEYPNGEVGWAYVSRQIIDYLDNKQNVAVDAIFRHVIQSQYVPLSRFSLPLGRFSPEFRKLGIKDDCVNHLARRIEVVLKRISEAHLNPAVQQIDIREVIDGISTGIEARVLFEEMEYGLEAKKLELEKSEAFERNPIGDVLNNWCVVL